MTFRNSLGSFNNQNLNDVDEIIKNIDDTNKGEKINLIVLNLGKLDTLNPKLEEFLIQTNKKVLLISEKQINFQNKFIFRQEVLENQFFTYFNNDIQYGAKFIIKRALDIV